MTTKELKLLGAGGRLCICSRNLLFSLKQIEIKGRQISELERASERWRRTVDRIIREPKS